MTGNGHEGGEMDAESGIPKRYGSISEVAKLMGLSDGTVRNLLATKQLTALRPVPGRVLIELAEVERLMHASANRERGTRGVATRAVESVAPPEPQLPNEDTTRAAEQLRP